MKRSSVVLGLLFLAVVSTATAQSTDDKVKAILRQIDAGQVDAARTKTAALASKIPNHPGILFLQGRLASNGTEGLKAYQSIIDNFPRSEWADDALAGMIQYYDALGQYKTADGLRQQLKLEYPKSPFAASMPVPAQTRTEQPVRLPSKDIAVQDSAPAAQKAPDLPLPYTLQVGAFSTAANAEKRKVFLEEQGMPVEVTNRVRAGKSFYLVWVGSYRTPDEAKDEGEELKRKYKLESIIVER